MDEILKGTLLSSHPQELKVAVIDRIMESIEAIGDEDAINRMLRACSMIIRNSSADFDVTMTKRILNAITRAHAEEVWNFFHQELTLALERGLFQQDDATNDKRALLELVSHVLSFIRSLSQNIPLQETSRTLISCFLVERTVSFCAILAEIIIQNWNENAIKEQGNELIDMMTKMLCKFSLKVDPKTAESPLMEISKKVNQVNTISSLFSKIIQINEKYVNFALNEIFVILCQKETPASVTLAPLLTSIPQEYAKFAADKVCCNQLINDINFDRLLCKLIDWLAWPASQNLDVWIITLCKNLLTDHKRHRLVTEVIRKKAVVVFNHMFCEVSRESALAVFSFMMLAYQQSPDIFHKVAPRFPGLLDLVEKGSKRNQEMLKALSELVYTLVYMFPGFPDINDNLLSLVKNHPQPPTEVMKQWLLGSPVIKQDGDMVEIVSYKPEKQISGKTGLNNLGNTCYMNSVVQALFMLESFRSKLFSMSLTSAIEPVTYSIARLFSFMSLSERSAISPTDFYRISRPPWFRLGAQQDCSEFLKHLIDILEREDKLHRQKQMHDDIDDNGRAPEPGIYEWFTGECKVDVKCTNCSVISSRYEAFTDVPLAFPDTLNDKKGPFSLRGGDISRSFSKGVNGDLPSSEKQDVIETRKVNELAQTSAPFAFDTQRELQPTPSLESERKPLNLQELLYSYLSTEVLDGQNQYRCDNCSSLQDAEQTHFLTTCPKFLILTLKRFTYDTKTHRRGKIMQNVKFPYDLTVPFLTMPRSDQNIAAVESSAIFTTTEDCDMDCDNVFLLKESNNTSTPETVGITRSSASSKQVLRVSNEESKSYSLVSVIVHAGVSSESGHYYCYCRSSKLRPIHMDTNIDTSSDKTGDRVGSPLNVDCLGTRECDVKTKDSWYLFNDSSVTRVNASDLERIQTDHPRDTPYVFIYEESSSNAIDHSSPRHSSQTATANVWAQEVESDNIEFRKENRMAKRPLNDALWQQKSRRWDDDRSDDNGGSSFGNCGGGFSSLGSNAGRFIY